MQHDLDAAGLEHVRLSYALAGGSVDHPTVNVQWRGTWTGDAIDVDADDLAYVAVDAARQTAQGLVELEGIYLPTCPEHNTRASAGLTSRREPAWTCSKRGVTPHVLARIGELHDLAPRARREGFLWRTLADLGQP